MGRIPKYTFLQSRDIEDQKAHDNMLNITNY